MFDIIKGIFGSIFTIIACVLLGLIGWFIGSFFWSIIFGFIIIALIYGAFAGEKEE